MANLITSARAQAEFGGALGSANTVLNAAEITTLDLITTAVGNAAEKYCRRTFESTAYDELHDPEEPGMIPLRRYPVISIQSARRGPVPVIEIQQTNTVTNQYATVAAQSAGLSLTRTASGVLTTVTTGLTYAANPTIDSMVAAIAALVATTLPGWQSRAITPYGLFPSADLYYQTTDLATEPREARGIYAPLPLHVVSFQNYQVSAKDGLFQPGHATYHTFFEYRTYPKTSLRIKYTAGYTTIPEDLQEAIAKWTAAVFYQTKARDPNAANVFTASAGTSYQELTLSMPTYTRLVLDQYKQKHV